MANLPTLPAAKAEKTITLRLTETEVNNLAGLLDAALKSPAGGLRVMRQVGYFMSKLSEELESGIVVANASDLPAPRKA